MSVPKEDPIELQERIEQRVSALLAQMTVAEKIGQMNQQNAGGADAQYYLADRLRAGQIGSVLNADDLSIVNELQRLAIEESRLGIPLLVGRDVIHGYKTVLPIPLGMAASWNPDLIREGAHVAAMEAATAGINWTFAPMIDISRDPRWGRIAESLGEDSYLTSKLGAAMIQGFQGDSLADPGAIAACAKHFAGYGAVESGRDYATTNIPENELRNHYLPPFRAAVDTGVATLMTAFTDLDGIPATANEFLMRTVLREEWRFDGLVVSDWDSVRQLGIHGVSENDNESAYQASTAGVDMEMAGSAYVQHLQELLDENRIDIAMIDTMVANILRVKFRLGLFEQPYTDKKALPSIASPHALETAKAIATQSVVLLKNDHDALPLTKHTLNSIAVIGPLADAPYEQLGTWIFDGDPELSITPLHAIRDLVEEHTEVHYVRAMENSRSQASDTFDEAVAIASKADVVALLLGEESILSGEAHSRADINLPGAQAQLVQRVRQTGKTVIAVILAGRPLTLTNIIDHVDAILYAWHPGTMGGPAIADLLFGVESPSGKLPVTFPRMVGQIPIYYNHKNTGKPPTDETVVHIDDIDAFAPQTSLGMTAFHLDAGYKPLFAFGHGLSYTNFHYSGLHLSTSEIEPGEVLVVSAELTNTGDVAATEIVQLYVRDLVGSLTRPVKELKGFMRVHLGAGETTRVNFDLHTNDLAFYNRNRQFMTEPGEFYVWIGGSSETELRSEFRLISKKGETD